MALVGLVLAYLIAGGLLLTLVDVLIGGSSIRDLADAPPVQDGPLVSVIVAARNEERGIEAGLRSLLRLAYPKLEVIVVNDRSSDGTAAILDRLAANESRVRVVTVAQLPPGWLGKNHALAVGAARAAGTLLVFTDADVIFEPTMVNRAVGVLERDHLDHLTAIPAITKNGIALTALVTTFGVLFAIYSRPWKARDAHSRHYIGVGAFNLIRADAYARMGTHAAIALRPDDDMRLARAVKQTGLRQDVWRAQRLLAVEWYTSVGGMIDGLMKNAYAGIDYNPAALVAATLALLAFNVWPWLALGLTDGTVHSLAVVSVAALSAIVLAHTCTSRVSPLYVLLYPLGILGFVYILWRSALLATSRGAISWRETSYELAALKQARPAARLDRPHEPAARALES